MPDAAAREHNEEIVRRFAELHNRGAEALLAAYDELMHPEFEFTPVVVGGVEGNCYRGRDGLRRWYEERDASFESASIELVSCRSVSDDTVLILARSIGRGRASGAEVNEEVGTVDEFKDGRLIRMRAFSSHRQAEEAATTHA